MVYPHEVPIADMADPLCLICEQPYSAHVESRASHEPIPRVGCLLLQSGFKTQGEREPEPEKTDPPPRVLVCINSAELDQEDEHGDPAEVRSYTCDGCKHWHRATGRAETGGGFCSKLGAQMNVDDFCSLHEDQP